MTVRNRKQYRPKRVSQASERELIAFAPATRLETRLETRLAHFNKLVSTLRGTAFYAGLLEASSITVAERACHAQLVSWSDEYLRRLLNFSELGRLLHQSAGSSTSAKNARLK